MGTEGWNKSVGKANSAVKKFSQIQTPRRKTTVGEMASSLPNKGRQLQEKKTFSIPSLFFPMVSQPTTKERVKEHWGMEPQSIEMASEERKMRTN